MDTQPVAISNLIIAIVFMFVGLRIAKHLSKLIHNKLIKVMNLDSSVSQLLGKILHYLFIIIVTIIVIDIAHVPLTVFTFIGGALAISIGVGGQHVLNNFISGIFLMIENPIKLGDLVEVGKVIGRVVSIDARSVNIKTQENRNVFIPHSIILQNEVINWTSTNSEVRLSTNFKISQGTIDINELKEIILNALKQNQEILIEPKPQLLLSSFEYNILNFELNFWANLAKVNRRDIISNVNFLINDTFANHKIKLAVEERKINK